MEKASSIVCLVSESVFSVVQSRPGCTVYSCPCVRIQNCFPNVTCIHLSWIGLADPQQNNIVWSFESFMSCCENAVVRVKVPSVEREAGRELTQWWFESKPFPLRQFSNDICNASCIRSGSSSFQAEISLFQQDELHVYYCVLVYCPNFTSERLGEELRVPRTF